MIRTIFPTLLRSLKKGMTWSPGWRKERIDNLILRRIPSHCANWLMARLSGVEIHDFGTTFKAYRREVIQNIPLYGEMHRFIPALASWYGASICEIPIRNLHRERGKSHYGIGRTFRVLFDLMTIRFLLRYMSRPMHFFGGFGALSITVGSVISAVLLGLKVFEPHQNVMDQHGPMFVIGAVLDCCRHTAAGYWAAGRIDGTPLSRRPTENAVRHSSPGAAGLRRRTEHDVGQGMRSREEGRGNRGERT